MWRQVNKLHEIQNFNFQQVRGLLSLVSASELTSDLHRLTTHDLEVVISSSHSGLNRLIKYQHECICAVYGWLKLTLFHSKSDNPVKDHASRVAVELPAFCDEWKQAHDRFPENVTLEAIGSFVNVIHVIYTKHAEELKIKKGTEIYSRELEKKSTTLINIEKYCQSYSMIGIGPAGREHEHDIQVFDVQDPLIEMNLEAFTPSPNKEPREAILLPEISFDPRSFVSALVQCQSPMEIRRVHALSLTTGMIRNLGVANKHIYIYAQHGMMVDAYTLFRQMEKRDNVSWSVMVGGFAKVGDYIRCLETFRDFVSSGCQMDNFTVPFVLRVCRDTMNLQLGTEIHHLVFKAGLHMDLFVSAALVDMYARCRNIEDARKLFNKMQKRDLVTWTVMISGYAECGNPEESLRLFDRMIEEGIKPDKIAMVAVVFACGKLGVMHKAKMIHDYIKKNNFLLNVIMGTAMIDMYAKCGSLDSAREIFDQMRERNVITWSSIISAYGIHGHGKEAMDLFSKMLRSGIRPNRITFVSILSACSHSGLVEDGQRFFDLMVRDYCIEPDVKHYTCIVDLLGRAGRLDEAMQLSERMKIDKDEGFWGALLGACRIHGNIELAEKAAKNLLQLGPRNSGYYVLLSNIYAKAGRWGDVSKVRNLMTSRRLQKTPGWTWIEINNSLHQFRVGDRLHPQSKEIYHMLKVLSQKLEAIGYVPNTEFVLHDIDEELKADLLYTHSEKLAISFGLLATPEGTILRIIKNLRVCGDCHTFIKMVSYVAQREIVVRDAHRFHQFKGGSCSCGDYW